MGNIYTIGETVYDIIFKNGQPLSANAGGAMLNTAVSLGRLELPVSLISEIAEDNIGNLVMNFLVENGVYSRYICRFSDGKTAVALAFLDDLENALYSFYKQYPANRLNISLPEPEPGDIVLFGSFFALTGEVREKLVEFIKTAQQNKAVIIYDPNFRPPHLKELREIIGLIYENISFSTLIRGSNEDFEMIFGTESADEAFKIVRKNGCKFLIFTHSDRSVEFRSDKYSLSVEVPKVKPVSTIGAGDSFNAGLIYAIYENNLQNKSPDLWSEDFWRKAITTAVSFGSHVCEHYDNYISKGFAKNQM
jgi:fructokinase